MDGLEVSSRAYFLWNNSWGAWGVADSGAFGGVQGAAGRAVTDATGAEVAREADTPMPVASLSKMMTALVVLERRELDEEVVITEEMLKGLAEFAVLGLRVGQRTTVEELLYATMLPSAGDAAQALALSTSGSIKEFAALMNARAAEIGMTNTQFSNPVGFDAGVRSGDHEGAENYSTARDIARLLGAALKHEKFREIFESFEKELPRLGVTVRKTFAASAGSIGAVAGSSGAAAGGGGSGVEYVTGGKTGFTNAAGRCLASTAMIKGTEYILVTLGAPADSDEHLRDAERIFAAVEEGYAPVKLLAAGDELVRMPVVGGVEKELTWRVADDVVVALAKDFPLEELTYEYAGTTEARRGVAERLEVADGAEARERLGYYRILYGEEVLYSQEIYLAEECGGAAGCAEVPEFHNYAWAGFGGAISLALTLAAVWGFQRLKRVRAMKGARKAEKATRGLKMLAWGAAGLAVASAVANLVIFWGWFANGAELTVYPLRAEVIDASLPEGGDEEAGEEETAEETPTEETEVSRVEFSADENCTTGFGNLMLINPNFTVSREFIAGRRQGLVSISQLYGIEEYHRAGNGDNLMVPEAATHLNEMLTAYREENPGHEMGTYSCFRAVGTSCGRLCAATGASDHHTGLTCDLIDLSYGDRLNTDFYANHLEWQWLKANSYKYGFIDRFPAEWAGGPMSEPLNVDASGSTGLFETWHYRYVGVTAATEIATGKYNGGRYDSLEHYLKATGRVSDLKGGVCR